MGILSTVKSVYFDRNEDKIFGIKSGILWGYSNRNNSMFPLLYFSKPKSVTEDDFKEILSRLEINMLEK